jgi:hypothetical protein
VINLRMTDSLPRLTFLVGLCASFLASSSRAADDKTFKPDEEGFIRNWVVLDPIALDAKVGEHTAETCKAYLEKEWVKKDATPKAGDKIKLEGVEGELAWRAAEASDYFVDLAKLAEDNGKQAENALFCGVTYVVCDKDIPNVKLSIGSDDDSLWRLNGQELIRVFEGRGIEKDQNKSEAVTLKKGVNVLTFAVINGVNPTSGCARFLDSNDKPVTGITVSVTPPAK